MDLDVRALMLSLLETQKEYVCEDLETYSCAMVAVFTADGHSYLQFPKFEDEVSKIADYTAIVEKAKLEGAVLIITVNNAFTRSAVTTAEMDESRWGDFDETNSQRCIFVTASGPGLESCSLELRYKILGVEVHFDEEQSMCGVEINMLPDWPGEFAPHVPN